MERGDLLLQIASGVTDVNGLCDEREIVPL
jgi:hypothetical protein